MSGAKTSPATFVAECRVAATPCVHVGFTGEHQPETFV